MSLSSAQIISLVCQICKAPGYTQQAGQLMNVVLGDYAQTYDLDTVRQTTVLNISAASASYALPANYLRGREVFYNVSGTIFYLNEMPLNEYDQQYIGPGVNEYPYSYATDMSTANIIGQTSTPPLMYFYPPPIIPLAVTVRFQPQTSDITSPETSSVIPWFPNQRVLMTDVCTEVMKITSDDRKVDFTKEVEKRMEKYLIMKDDSEGFAKQVQLDKRSFRSVQNVRPTKLTGF